MGKQKLFGVALLMLGTVSAICAGSDPTSGWGHKVADAEPVNAAARPAGARATEPHGEGWGGTPSPTSVDGWGRKEAVGPKSAAPPARPAPPVKPAAAEKPSVMTKPAPRVTERAPAAGHEARPRATERVAVRWGAAPEADATDSASVPGWQRLVWAPPEAETPIAPHAASATSAVPAVRVQWR